jgi:hypothetical protein
MMGLIPNGFSQFFSALSDLFPPPNPSLRWFRVVLWLMPTCLAFTTAQLAIWLQPGLGGSSGSWLLGWGGMNLATTYGLGILDRKSSRSKLPPDDVFPPEVQFFVLQLILVPALLLGMVVIRWWIG